ncbi:MAG: hypothetical protein HZB33_03805 [Nitrospirae bacterium]|nr:hypothetical protein [Nitrospirota bacterium]
MGQNKICPNCKTEYYPHIEICADCGAGLLLSEEFSRAEAEKKRLGEKAPENTVMVLDGELDWMRELHAVLIDAGIPGAVQSNSDCRKGCCGTKCRLVVSPDDLARAQDRIQEYFMEISPELRVSHDLLMQGKCPACGSPVGADARDCADCGLSLVIVEEE